jgi:signal transduction histidine kinase
MRVDGTIDHIDGVCVETHGINAILRDVAEHKRLESMKDNFIVAVTHELRTPLVSIRGYLDHILLGEGDLPAVVRSQLEIVGRNANRLLELTNDLLNFEGVQKPRVEKLEIQGILSHCIEEVQPLLKEKNQELRLEFPDKPLVVLGDPLRLSEVILNVLTNANKFTTNNGRVTIRVEEGDADVTVYVTDSGIGISEGDVDHVFEPFAPIKKPAYFKGSGLGLSLAKKLIEAQGGKIWVTSEGSGLGATFAFTLPKPREELIRISG